MRLTKHHALGNDFLVLLDPDGVRPVGADVARAVCDRHRGVGADGLLRVTRAAAADVTMQLFNADGGRAEMSGNGISCLAQAVVLAGLATGPEVRVTTDAGPRAVRIEPTVRRGEHRATVDMGAAKVGDDEPEWMEDDVLRAARVDVGNPHLVLHMPEYAGDDDLVGRGVRVNELVPGGINVEIVVPDGDTLEMHVYERGVGLTEACGTGACAVAAAAARWELAGNDVTVRQPGGDARVALGDTIHMTVPVVHVATIDYPDA